MTGFIHTHQNFGGKVRLCHTEKRAIWHFGNPTIHLLRSNKNDIIQ